MKRKILNNNCIIHLLETYLLHYPNKGELKGRVYQFKIFSILFTILFFVSHSAHCSSISIEPNKEQYCVGDTVAFQGYVVDQNLSQPVVIVVSDSVTRMSSKITTSKNGQFVYSPKRSIQSEGIFAFKFTTRSKSNIKPQYVLISAKNCKKPFVKANWVKIKNFTLKLGGQGSTLNEAANIFAKQFEPNSQSSFLVDKKSMSWRDYYLESLVEASRSWGNRFIKNLSSPSNILVYSAASIVCITTGPVGCALAVSFVFKQVLLTSIWTDIELLIDEADNKNISDSNREEIKLWSKMGYTTLVSVMGLSSHGGILEATSFVGNWGELAWEGRPKIKQVQYSPDGKISSFAIYVTTKSGDEVAYVVTKGGNEAQLKLFPHDNYYLDMKLVFKNGNELLCTVISGQFKGISYGMSDSNLINYFIVKNKNGEVINIPNQELKDVIPQKIRITSINGFTAEIDKGNFHQVKKNAIFSVYRQYEDFLSHRLHDKYIGLVKVNEVYDNSASVVILKIYDKNSIVIGDFCK